MSHCERCKRPHAQSLIERTANICKRAIALKYIERPKAMVHEAECFQASHHLVSRRYPVLARFVDAVEQLRVAEGAPILPIPVIIRTPDARDRVLRFSICVLAYAVGREFQRNLVAETVAPQQVIDAVDLAIRSMVADVVTATITWAS